jgi:hypothetical protein
MRIDPKELGRTLIKRFGQEGPGLFRKGRKVRKDRTATVFKILRRLAGEYGLDFYPSESRRRKELLCDFMGVAKPFMRVVLAAECEWNIGKKNRALVKDFKKLMLVRAWIRLFVYQIRPASGSNEPASIRNSLANVLGKFHDHRRGDRYLLLEIDRRPEVRRIHGFYCQVGNDGRITKPTFAPFGETAASRH